MRGHRQRWQQRLDEFFEGEYEITIGLCNTDTSCLAHFSLAGGKAINNWETWNLAQQLQLFTGLRHAEVNRVLQIASVPNDPFYRHQWHYGAMHLEAAWEVTTGGDEVIAAVIDTGVLLEHPELKNKIIDQWI